MIVVSDASPLNYLIEIGYIEVLSRLFARIVIPAAVAEELGAHRSPQRNRDWLARLPQSFEIAAARQIDHSLDLDAGEIEAICLAAELGADALLIDEMEGRHVALKRGLRLFGTVGILELAARSDLLAFDEAIEKLSQTRFYMSQKLRREALERWRIWRGSQ